MARWENAKPPFNIYQRTRDARKSVCSQQTTSRPIKHIFFVCQNAGNRSKMLYIVAK